ncbi:MAG: alpha/beta hydrolase fold domain-containing protein [Reyranellaceae bacterium]
MSRERARNIRSLLYPKPDLPKGRIERSTILAQRPHHRRAAWPVDGQPIGTLVYYHGSSATSTATRAHAIRIANCGRVTVLNIDYRSAPEHPFPQGVDDAIASTQWAARISAAPAAPASHWRSAATAPAATSPPPLPSFAATRASRSRLSS